MVADDLAVLHLIWEELDQRQRHIKSRIIKSKQVTVNCQSLHWFNKSPPASNKDGRASKSNGACVCPPHKKYHFIHTYIFYLRRSYIDIDSEKKISCESDQSRQAESFSFRNIPEYSVNGITRVQGLLGAIFTWI